MVSYISRIHFELNTYRIIIASLLLFLASAAFAQDYKTITAQKGDGIYSVLKQNGLSPKEYLDQFVELNKTKLGKDNSLIIGRTYRLPIIADKKPQIQDSAPVTEASQEKIVYEIFGDKYKEVTIRSRELSKAVFYLMSGHGGPDPGAIGTLNGHLLCEDEYAYDVTLRLARSLIERGATVYMIIRDPNDGIRDEQFLVPDRDEVCFPNDPIPLNQLARLRQSTEAVNKLYIQNKGKFQRLVVVHIDSRSQKENIDVFFYHDKRSDTGKNLANTLKDTFGERYARHQPTRGYNGSVSERNLYVIKNSFSPSVFIELGNINHTRDQKRFIFSDNRQAVSNWLRDGLIHDFNKSFK
ncbi:MAG: N-acetylmuramoyl-L-alanine amidase [Bacteroidota bacterium]|nr:N-acetylmuramoyl-L-alanine amidase [Bacteroidota bacterium]